jgi:hypothetical protein
MASVKFAGGVGSERDCASVVRKLTRRMRKRGTVEQAEREPARKDAAVSRVGSAGESVQVDGGIGVGSAEVGGGGGAPGVRTMGWELPPAAAAGVVEALVIAAKRVIASAQTREREGRGVRG